MENANQQEIGFSLFSDTAWQRERQKKSS